MQSMDIFEAPRWYAIHTKSRQEDKADQNLRAWGIQTFSPKIREPRRNFNYGRPAYLTKPLFATYIFARFKANDLLHKISRTRGVQSVLSAGGNPCPVEDEIIDVIRARQNAAGFIKLNNDLNPGDKVIISGGYLRDFAGVFEEDRRDQDRVAILLTTITYQGRVVIEREWVRKAGCLNLLAPMFAMLFIQLQKSLEIYSLINSAQ